MHIGNYVNGPLFFSDSTFDCNRLINIKFHENTFSTLWNVTHGQIDRHGETKKYLFATELSGVNAPQIIFLKLFTI
jgi:hypothetical protein